MQIGTGKDVYPARVRGKIFQKKKNKEVKNVRGRCGQAARLQTPSAACWEARGCVLSLSLCPCVPVPIPATSYPVAAAITQPPCSGVASTQQPWLSWLMPKLWPISWAMVAAAPMGCSAWSCRGKGGWVSFGVAHKVPKSDPRQPWDRSWVPREEGLWKRWGLVSWKPSKGKIWGWR